MVGAVAVIGLTDSDWAVALAVALMLCLLCLVLNELRRELDQGSPPADTTTGGGGGLQ